jgi:hypothetical protein
MLQKRRRYWAMLNKKAQILWQKIHQAKQISVGKKLQHLLAQGIL